MAKFRCRVSSKGKRWKKGQSSSSNPTASKYREAAKSRFFQENIENSNLTKEAVKKHDAFTNAKTTQQEEMEDELETVGGKTFKTFETFATDWSSCSNTSFNKLLNNFQSNSIIHKEMLAVLAAVTEVIKSNGGTETSTEYFGALMVALETAEGNETSVIALLNLLGMGMKGVPTTVLQHKFPEISKIFVDLLAKHAIEDNFAIIRPLLGCLSVVLRAQEGAAWSSPSTLNVLDSMLAFITYTKPKIRKAAQHGVVALVVEGKMSESGLAHIGQHCLRLLEGVSKGAITSTLHTLAFVRDVIHCFPKKELKECCEAILKVMTLNNVLLTSCGMQSLHDMFLNQPPSSNLPPERNGRLIAALYDYQPSATDSQPTQAWAALITQAHLNLARNDLGLCLAHLPRFVTTLSELYLSEKVEVQASATYSIESCILDCLTKAAAKENVAKYYSEIAKISALLQSRLSYQYRSAWTHVLHLLSALFKAIGGTCSKCLMPCLKGLAELRDSYQFAYTSELDKALGNAIRTIGPQIVLTAIPLQISTEDKNRDFKRSWLLPILKDNIKSATLRFFTEYFLPQATICRNESQRLREANDQVGALSYDLFQSQIWSLLPSFSNQPSDIAESFPILAKALGGVLSTRKDLRLAVMSSLRRLITFSLDNSRDEDLKALSKYAKNYLPLLFIIYTSVPKGSDEEGARLAAYETIKVYLKLSEHSLCNELFEKAYGRLEDSAEADFMKESVLDLLRVLLPYQSSENIAKLFEMIRAKIGENEGGFKQQKKFYRLLEELCTSDAPVCTDFILENLSSVKDLLVSSLSKAAPNSKGARLKCLLELIKRSGDESALLVEAILPEAILCVKDVNSRCRETAYKLLEAMAEASQPRQFVELVMLGLSGSQNAISSTLLALAAVVFHYKDKLDEEVEESVVNNVGILAMSSSREVVGAALSFIKVYIQAFTRDKIARFVPNLMLLLSKMNEDCKRHSRTKSRDILSRLVRWYGGDTILRATPQSDQVLRARVRNLGKILERKKKLREEQRQGREEESADQFSVKGKPKSIEEILAESDSDLDYMEDEEEKRPAKKQARAWITETADDIVDFTDTQATTKKISMSKPEGKKTEVAEKKKSKKKSEFKTAADGRLVIADQSDSDDEAGPKKKKPFIPGFDGNSDSDDYVASEGDEEPMEEEEPKKRKRMLSASTTGAPNTKYQAGGSGIHRPISKVLSKKGGPGSRNKKERNGAGPAGAERSGEVYKARKAMGDMKRKGLPAPYAYLPLRKDALNRRKKMKNVGQFNSLVRGARKGAAKGTKQRSSQKK